MAKVKNLKKKGNKKNLKIEKGKIKNLKIMRKNCFSAGRFGGVEEKLTNREKSQYHIPFKISENLYGNGHAGLSHGDGIASWFIRNGVCSWTDTYGDGSIRAETYRLDGDGFGESSIRC